MFLNIFVVVTGTSFAVMFTTGCLWLTVRMLKEIHSMLTGIYWD